jgi:hypothetical protein
MQETGIHPPRALMESFWILPEGRLMECVGDYRQQAIRRALVVFLELTFAFTLEPGSSLLSPQHIHSFEF